MVELVFLSPHLDDAVLSCAGMIAQRSLGSFSPLIVTPFAGTPDYDRLSPFARVQHTYWGDPANPMALRRQEDQAAARRLGARTQHLSFLDAVYRRDDAGRPLYPSEAAIFGPLQPEDESLIAQIAGDVGAMFPVVNLVHLYAPLAIGNHVDHQVVRAVATALVHQGYHCTFYEDFPYADRADGKTTAGHTDSLQAIIEPLDAVTLDAKIEAIACYDSQMDILFGDLEQMIAAVTAHGRRYAVDLFPAGERYWQQKR